MTKDEILAKLRDILVDQVDADPAKVTMDATFQDDLQLDSLDLVEAVDFIAARS